MKTPRPNSRGFTLIEIMVVVAIIGLIATLGIPSIYQIAKKEGMRRAVSDLTDTLGTARAQAILSGREVQVKFYPLDRRFEITGGATSPTADSGMADAPPPEALNRTTGGTLPADISFGALMINLLNFRESEWTRVRFFPNGTSDELRLVLVSETGEARGIELETTTGLWRTVSDIQEIRTWELQ